MNKYKQWRCERNISIRGMAKMLSISTTTLQRLENRPEELSDKTRVYAEFKFNQIINKEEK